MFNAFSRRSPASPASPCRAGCISIGRVAQGGRSAGWRCTGQYQAVREANAPRPVDRGSELVAASVEPIAAAWRELCLWDPLLPPDCAPPIAPAVIAAIGAALARPQPIGWGPDPEVEKVIEVFATAVGSI